MKSKIVDWFKAHWWCVVLIVFSLIVLIPVLITIIAPYVSSEVSADGLLGYIIQALSAVGTIFLAYIAIRQNERFKEENDKAQARLEKIALNANELSLIGKVIEYESTNIAKLTEKVEKYYTACSADGFVEYLKRNNITQDESGICLAKERKKSELKQLFSDLFDEIKLDFRNFDKLETISNVVFNMQSNAEALLEKMYEVSLPDGTGDIEPDINAFLESRTAFRNEMNILITRKRVYLDYIIFGQISYNKIKKDHYGEKKES